jgi:hypothetical protein
MSNNNITNKVLKYDIKYDKTIEEKRGILGGKLIK